MSAKVYKLFQLGRKGKSFDKEMRVIKRNQVVIDESIAESANAEWQQTGLLYQLDEKATAKLEKNLGINKKSDQE